MVRISKTIEYNPTRHLAQERKRKRTSLERRGLIPQKKTPRRRKASG